MRMSSKKECLKSRGNVGLSSVSECLSACRGGFAAAYNTADVYAQIVMAEKKTFKNMAQFFFCPTNGDLHLQSKKTSR